MAKLIKVREELQFNREMTGIINVLKGVAVSEFARLQRGRKRFDEFEAYLKNFFQIVDLGNLSHVFLEDSSIPANIVVITSDIGFLGKLNISIIAAVFEQYKQDDQLTVIGKQGGRYIEGMAKEFSYFPGVSDNISFGEVERLRDYVIKQVVEKKAGRTIIIYPHFVSFGIQEIQIFQLFPCRFLFSEKTKSKDNKDNEVEEERVIIEPSLKRIVEYLIRVWTGYIIYTIFQESKLSEWAARVIHLEGSSDELKRQVKEARFRYFRALHENSDRNIREIFSSTMALGHARQVKYEK